MFIQIALNCNIYAMAAFQTKTFIEHDDYMTPKYVLEWIT